MIVFGLGALTVFAGLLLGFSTLLQPKRVSRLVPAAPAADTSVVSSAKRFAGHAAAVADRAIDGDRRTKLETALEQADITMSVGEVVAGVVGGGLLALALGAVVGGPLLGVFLAVGVVGVSAAFVQRRAGSRQRRFEEQLPDLLQLLSGNLRVGYGLLQAMESASTECEAPAGPELARAMSEVRLGRDLVGTLTEMGERLHSEDFGWIVQAIAINREVGGDLAEVLDSVADTIRARQHLARQVSALSAEGRISAYVLLALPIVVAAMTSITNPGYLAVLYTTGPGLVLSFVSVTMMTAGALWLRRLIRPIF